MMRVDLGDRHEVVTLLQILFFVSPFHDETKAPGHVLLIDDTSGRVKPVEEKISRMTKKTNLDI